MKKVFGLRIVDNHKQEEKKEEEKKELDGQTRAINDIMKDPDNLFCFECAVPYPQWVSINNAIFLCKDCANAHRSLGTGIS